MAMSSFPSNTDLPVAEDSDEESMCRACLDTNSNRRKLSNCFHSFCEVCLAFIVKELEPEENCPSFHCPACRQVNPGPKSGQDALDWIKALERDSDASKHANTGTVEEADSLNLCGGCRQATKKKKAIVAVQFCFDCHEYYCKDCCQFVHEINAFKDHSLMGIDTENVAKVNSNQEEAKSMIMKYMTCEKHPGKGVAFLCRDDDRLCCMACAVEENRMGKSVFEIKTFTTKESNDAKLDELYAKLEKLNAIGESIIANKKDTEQVGKKEADTVVNEIRNMRQVINGLFDSLEMFFNIVEHLQRSITLLLWTILRK